MVETTQIQNINICLFWLTWYSSSSDIHCINLTTDNYDFSQITNISIIYLIVDPSYGGPISVHFTKWWDSSKLESIFSHLLLSSHRFGIGKVVHKHITHTRSRIQTQPKPIHKQTASVCKSFLHEPNNCCWLWSGNVNSSSRHLWPGLASPWPNFVRTAGRHPAKPANN